MSTRSAEDIHDASQRLVDPRACQFCRGLSWCRTFPWPNFNKPCSYTGFVRFGPTGAPEAFSRRVTEPCAYSTIIVIIMN
jgi:hypothetical protein